MSAAEKVRYMTGFAIARDGKKIGYRQLGQGPGLVIVHGAMSSAHNHMQLAELLADDFTVYVLDRRGRGLSDPFSPDYSIQKDVEDMEAILEQTGAAFVFGVSSGAIISLKTAMAIPTLRKIAIFEPPLFMRDDVPIEILTRFDREIAQGNTAAALVTGMKGGQMGPALFNHVPNWLLAQLVSMSMRSEDKQTAPEYIPMRTLAPLLHYDFQLVVEMSGKIKHFRDMQAEVLLLGGSKSPTYLKAALDVLENVLPHAERIEFPDLNHSASWNMDRGGQPEPLSRALRDFFKS